MTISSQHCNITHQGRKILPVDCVIGAGTVYIPSQIEQVRPAGGELIVIPHNHRAVIDPVQHSDLQLFLAWRPRLKHSQPWRTIVKLLSADHLDPAVVKALRAVLRREICFIAVGGLTPQSLADFVAASAIGFRLGSALYVPGMTTKRLTIRAAEFVSAWRNTQAQL